MSHVLLIAGVGHGEICSWIQGALNYRAIDYVEQELRLVFFKN